MEFKMLYKDNFVYNYTFFLNCQYNAENFNYKNEMNFFAL